MESGTPIHLLGTTPTLEQLATTHAHPPRFSQEEYELNGSGVSQRICIGGCTASPPTDEGQRNKPAPAT